LLFFTPNFLTFELTLKKKKEKEKTDQKTPTVPYEYKKLRKDSVLGLGVQGGIGKCAKEPGANFLPEE